MQKKWRRFRPIVRGRLDDQTAYQPESIYAGARQIINEVMRGSRSRIGARRRDVLKDTSEAVRVLRERDPRDPAHLLALLILQAPNAARAQNEMDSHHGGYRNREARLFELIDFNDTYVETVLSLDDADLVDFADRLKVEIDRFCSVLHTAGFSEKQFEAITHGLSREIAVYRAARSLGYIARMTSRVQDAMGVDMVITDTETKKSINIDVKTRSAYHFRLIELMRERRVDEQKRLHCELAGYCAVRNGRGDQAVDTILLQVDTGRLGEINNYNFDDTGPIATLLSSAINRFGRYLSGTY